MIIVIIEPHFWDVQMLYLAQRDCEDFKLATSSHSSLDLELRLVYGFPNLGNVKGPRFCPYAPVSLGIR